MASTDPSIRTRIAGLQIPTSRIESLALAALHMLDELTPINVEADRQIVSHITNFADLIVEASRQLSKEAEGIEVDVPHSLTTGGR